ncbi:hypothetical protein ON010_g417 [Phytophthora cinnamomi]|nr:hypothetical protein ON010_g417 [Phytophthora cinnamomi]
MRRRHHNGVLQKVAITIQCCIWCQAQGVAADCWIGSDGKEICNTDPTGLRATWWFFFALLLFACAATGCFDADWGFCGIKDDALEWTRDTQAARLENGLQDDDRTGLGVSLMQSLLSDYDTDKMQSQAIPSPPKPVYRYLDP